MVTLLSTSMFFRSSAGAREVQPSRYLNNVSKGGVNVATLMSATLLLEPIGCGTIRMGARFVRKPAPKPVPPEAGSALFRYYASVLRLRNLILSDHLERRFSNLSNVPPCAGMAIPTRHFYRRIAG